MKLSTTSIQRPVFASVMSFTILLFGIIAFTRLPVREYPDIDPPIVSVVDAVPRGESERGRDGDHERAGGAVRDARGGEDADVVEPRAGSVITIEFELDRNVDEAANDVRDRVSRVRGSLPREIEDPVISKVDANAQAIVWLALSSDRHTGLELTDVADRMLKERIQRLPGVGSVIIAGERRYAMRVWLDPLRMAAHGLDARRMLKRRSGRENAEIPGGQSGRAGAGVFRPDARGAFHTRRIRRDHRMRRRGTTSSACATLPRSPWARRTSERHARYNGQPAVGLGIVKQSKASTVDVAAEVRKALQELTGLAPGGNEAGRRLRLVDFHQGIDRRSEGDAHHCHGPRRSRGAGVPQELPRDDNSDARHSDLDHRGACARRISPGFTINILTLARSGSRDRAGRG